MLFTMKVDLEDGEKIERASKLVNSFSQAAQIKIVQHYGVLHLVKDNIMHSDLKMNDSISSMQNSLPDPTDISLSENERKLIMLKHEILSAWSSDCMVGIMKRALTTTELSESLVFNSDEVVDLVKTMDKYGMRNSAHVLRHKVAMAMAME